MNVSASALIAAVHRRRALWDPHDVHHHNRVVVNGLWQEVGSEIGISMSTAKSKWRGLRDYYRQQMRRNSADLSEDTKYQSSWVHFEEMSFLDGTMPQKRSSSGIVMKEERTSPEVNANEALDHNWDNVWVDPVQSAIPNYTKYPDSEVSDQEDDDLHFFKSLLPDMRGLSRHKKAFIRLRIQELIFKEVYGGVKIDSNPVSSQEEKPG